YRAPMTAQAATQVIEAGEGAITPGAAAAERAARTLAAGGLVAFPTETVYRLGADPTQGPAGARLFVTKGRAPVKPPTAPLAAPPHRPRRRRRRGARARALGRYRPTARACVLAGAADAGAVQACGLPGRRTCHRRPRYHRRARAQPSRRARHFACLRPPGGGAFGQPLRARLAYDRATRAARPAP